MILSGGILPLLVSVAAAIPQQTPTQAVAEDRAPVVRRVAATAQLAAQEYRAGVVDGRVVAKAEVEEATMFLQEARRSGYRSTSCPPRRRRSPAAPRSTRPTARAVTARSAAETGPWPKA